MRKVIALTAVAVLVLGMCAGNARAGGCWRIQINTGCGGFYYGSGWCPPRWGVPYTCYPVYPIYQCYPVYPIYRCYPVYPYWSYRFPNYYCRPHYGYRYPCYRRPACPVVIGDHRSGRSVWTGRGGCGGYASPRFYGSTSRVNVLPRSKPATGCRSLTPYYRPRNSYYQPRIPYYQPR